MTTLGDELNKLSEEELSNQEKVLKVYASRKWYNTKQHTQTPPLSDTIDKTRVYELLRTLFIDKRTGLRHIVPVDEIKMP